MTSLSSQINSPWGFFDSPEIYIQSNFSEFEPCSSDPNSSCLTPIKPTPLPDTTDKTLITPPNKPFYQNTETCHTDFDCSPSTESRNSMKGKWNLLFEHNETQQDLSLDELEDPHPEKKVKLSSSLDITHTDQEIRFSDSTTNEISPSAKSDYDRAIENSPQSASKSERAFQEEQNTCCAKENKEKGTHIQKEIIRIVSMDGQKKRWLFEVESQSFKNKEKKIILRKEEIIKQDPLMLVYFYEKLLKFKKTKDFSGETLKKI